MGRASYPAGRPKQVTVAQELAVWDAEAVWESVHVETLLTRHLVRIKLSGLVTDLLQIGRVAVGMCCVRESFCKHVCVRSHYTTKSMIATAQHKS